VVDRFKNILESKGIQTYVRRPRGRDIFAACGQLAARQGALNTRSETTLVGAHS
jgi:adenine C2-methylase RlmN of 23S rRNA A2503 and tRNA A37